MRKHKVFFTIVYVLLLAVFFISIKLSHKIGNWPMALFFVLLTILSIRNINSK